jgi:hypothetical protein
VLDGVREWMDRLGYILIVLIKDLIELYKSKGLGQEILEECYAQYIRLTILHSFRYIWGGSTYKDKVSLKEYYKFLLSKPKATTKGIYLLIKEETFTWLSHTVRKLSPQIHAALKKKRLGVL